MPTLLSLAALFGRVFQAHPDSDRRLCRNRVRRSAHCKAPLLAPVGQLPTAVPDHRARWPNTAGLSPRHSQLRRRSERPDWF